MKKLELVELLQMGTQINIVAKDLGLENDRVRQDLIQAYKWSSGSIMLLWNNNFKVEVSDDGFVTFETAQSNQLICKYWMAQAESLLFFTNTWNDYFSEKQIKLDALEDAKAELAEYEATEEVFGFANVFKKEAN